MSTNFKFTTDAIADVSSSGTHTTMTHETEVLVDDVWRSEAISSNVSFHQYISPLPGAPTDSQIEHNEADKLKTPKNASDEPSFQLVDAGIETPKDTLGIQNGIGMYITPDGKRKISPNDKDERYEPLPVRHRIDFVQEPVIGVIQRSTRPRRTIKKP